MAGGLGAPRAAWPDPEPLQAAAGAVDPRLPELASWVLGEVRRAKSGAHVSVRSAVSRLTVSVDEGQAVALRPAAVDLALRGRRDPRGAGTDRRPARGRGHPGLSPPGQPEMLAMAEVFLARARKAATLVRFAQLSEQNRRCALRETSTYTHSQSDARHTPNRAMP